jgi:hypothetical protein
MDAYEKIDEALLPFNEHIHDMLSIEGEAYDEEKGIRMQINEVGIESPLQLDIIVDDDGKVTLGSSPPLYYFETGVMPVFHRLTIRAVIDHENNVG